MEKEKIKDKLVYLRKKAYKMGGSYEDSYIYLMNGLDRIIKDLEI